MKKYNGIRLSLFPNNDTVVDVETIESKNETKNTRNNKGTNLLLFPTDYTVVDIETTGLSPQYDEIIEICAIRYRNKEFVEKYTTLIKPKYKIDDFIEELTGITNDMLATAPKIEKILPKFLEFLGNDIIVGHNVNFDINFIYDNCIQYLSKPLSNDFVDTMRIARLLHKENKHNRLSDIAQRYNLSYDGAHRAEYDCLLTNNILQIFDKEFNESYDDNVKLSSLLYHGVKAADITSNVTDFDIDNPIYDKTVVFTGVLEKMTRKEAMQIVADLGGINGDNITKKTNYLVLGNNDYCKTIKDGKSGKQKKAEKYKLDGCDIEIIPENVFYDMIDSHMPVESPSTVKETKPDPKEINSFPTERYNNVDELFKNIYCCCSRTFKVTEMEYDFISAYIERLKQENLPCNCLLNRLSTGELIVYYGDSRIGAIKFNGKNMYMYAYTKNGRKKYEDKTMSFYLKKMETWIEYIIEHY